MIEEANTQSVKNAQKPKTNDRLSVIKNKKDEEAEPVINEVEGILEKKASAPKSYYPHIDPIGIRASEIEIEVEQTSQTNLIRRLTQTKP